MSLDFQLMIIKSNNTTTTTYWEFTRHQRPRQPFINNASSPLHTVKKLCFSEEKWMVFTHHKPHAQWSWDWEEAGTIFYTLIIYLNIKNIKVYKSLHEKLLLRFTAKKYTNFLQESGLTLWHQWTLHNRSGVHFPTPENSGTRWKVNLFNLSGHHTAYFPL